MRNEFDDEYFEDENDDMDDLENQYGMSYSKNYLTSHPQGVPYSQIYFCNGLFKFSTLNDVAISNTTMRFSGKITKVKNLPNSKSIFDIFEEFDNSYLLEFLITILANNGIIDIDGLNKVIKIDAEGASIIVTAVISSVQDYINIEDYLESTAKSTDIITVGNHNVLRSEQTFYCISQAVKYSILSYTSIDNGIDWTKDTIDWSIVYYNLIEPYVKYLIKMALKYNKQLSSVKEFKDYIDFNVQFAIVRNETDMYCEIYTLPKSVYGHNVYYDNINGRQVLIGLNREGYDGLSNATGDQFRICAGTQNLNLVPINTVNIKTLTYNGEFTVELNELPVAGDILYNKFAFGMTQSTKLNQEDYVYLTQIEGLKPCKIDMDNKYPSVFMYYGFTDANVLNDDIIAIQIDKNASIYGVCCLLFSDAIPPDLYTSSINETEDTKLFPYAMKDILKGAYKFSEDMSFRLLPIRALPTYREYLVIGITSHSKSDESQSDIILKKASTTGSKRKFWPFRKRGDNNEV